MNAVVTGGFSGAVRGGLRQFRGGAGRPSTGLRRPKSGYIPVGFGPDSPRVVSLEEDSASGVTEPVHSRRQVI